MDAIEGKLYSPHEKTVWRTVPAPAGSNNSFQGLIIDSSTEWESFDASVSKIRKSPGFPISTFRELISEVALVTLNNKKYEMFYRGQTKDYMDCQGAYYQHKPKKTIIYPSICRPERKDNGDLKQSIRRTTVKKRYEDLYKFIHSMTGENTFHYEYYFTLLQHYDILPTPLIDITQSLRIAATFALQDTSIGYLYVFGLPYPNQSISHFTDLGIVLVKLQNICPVKALRPRYQEGYLVGKYPFNFKKEEKDNLARRLVAKFKLDNTSGKFWDNDFQKMPNDLLFPKNDVVEKSLLDYKKNSSKF